MVLISHGAGEDRFFHHNLATELAKQGFIVAAPTHPGDNIHDMANLFTARQFIGRLEDFDFLITALADDAYIGPHIDLRRIGLVGFGAGADTALLAAGGGISQQAWERWKAEAPPDTPYLKPWAKKRIEKTLQTAEVRQSLANPLLKTLVAIAPEYDIFFDKNALVLASGPVLLMTRTDGSVKTLQIAASLAPGSRLIPTGSPRALDYIAKPESDLATIIPGETLPSDKQHAALVETMIRETSRFLLDTIGKPQ